MKFTEDECRALNILLNGQEFPRVMGAIARFTEEQNKILVMNSNTDQGHLFRQQGKTQALVTLMEAIVESPKRLEQITAPKV